MVIKVGINGFGRFGRIVSRACLQNSGFQLAAINDPAISADYVSYLMKYDSTHGKLNRTVTYNDNEIFIDGQPVKVFHEKSPLDIPWQTAGVQYVVEASGMFTNFEKASGHLVSIGVKRVIVTAPSVDVPMVILGVNDKNIPPDRRVISCASSTLYCLAPIIKVLEDNFGVEDGFVTSIHAMTPSLKPQDGLCLRGKHWRDHRSIHQNIIPAHMGACKAIGKILPSVKDKLTGLAFRVPIVNVSLLDLTVRLRINTSLSNIIAAVQHASKSSLRNIIKVCKEESVSSDFIGESHSCILEEDSSLQLKPNFFKIICWYENEHSYACRVIDSIIFSENQFYLETPIVMNSMRPAMSSKLLQTEKLLSHFCNYKPRGSNDLVPTMSQDTGVESKTSNQSLLERKRNCLAISTLTFPKKSKTDELIKIWNNRSEIQTSLEPTTYSFFHSCVGFPSSTLKKIECNSQQCLENVKREFTKMVSITEDLLRKTQSYQGVRYPPKDDNKSGSVDNIGPHEDNLKEEDKSNVKMYNNKGNSAQELDSKCSGDTFQLHEGRSLKDKKSFSAIHNEGSESNIFDSNIIRDSQLLNISEPIKELCDEDMKEEGIQLESKRSNRNFLSPDKSNLSVCNKQTENSISTSLPTDDILPQNKQDLLYKDPESESNGDCQSKIIVNEESNMKLGDAIECIIQLSNSKNEHFSVQHKKVKSPENNSSQNRKIETTCKMSKCELNEVNNKIEIIHKELKKRKIILLKKLLQADKESKHHVEDNYNSVNEKDETVEESIPNVSKPVFADNYISEVRSKCGYHSLTTQYCMDNDTRDICDGGLREGTQDIYDDGLRENTKDIDDGGLRENTQDIYDGGLREGTQDIYDGGLRENTQDIYDGGLRENTQDICNGSLREGTQDIYDDGLRENTKDIYDGGLREGTQDIYDGGLRENTQDIYDGGLCENTQDICNGSLREGTQDIYDDGFREDTKDIYDGGLRENTQDIYDGGLREGTQDIYDGGLRENTQDICNGGLREGTQDIYDKLESNSETDSENSFQVNEKKSQIIQISDLTQSVDDLTRLNNICRIIEISDEMSDKLFSALDDVETDKKTWSLKDLCTKLNLDEFCNKVFGGTAV